MRSALLYSHNVRATPAIASATAAWPASGLRASSTTMARSARASSLRARRMPSRSIVSPPSRRPAVSTSVNSMPSIRTTSCSRSRVVPAMSVTIARSLPASALSSELLPALGGPTITACRPSRRRRPRSAARSKSSSAAPRLSKRTRNAAPPSVSSDSSAKSIAASTWTRIASRSSAIASTRRENSPSSARRAARAARASPAAIRSATASAWTRSRRPSRNARSLNSPGRA